MATALTDHDRIREWAEAHGAVPASVRGTGRKGDPGILRLDMPGGAGNESLQPIGWDDWFRKFDAQELALLVDEHSRASTFNKLVNRNDVNPAPRSRGAASKESSMANPNQQRNRRGAGTDGEQTDPARDDLREADADADVDDLDDDVDEEDEFEDDDVETDDEAIDEDDGDDKERA